MLLSISCLLAKNKKAVLFFGRNGKLSSEPSHDGLGRIVSIN
jgi:hypothetical protein